MYDVHSSDASAVFDYEGVTKNITCVGFSDSGMWMYSGGEDKTASIWDLRQVMTLLYCNSNCIY